MRFENDKEYYMKDLRKYLADEGIPCSKPTLYKYEMEGVFRPQRKNIFGRATRVFTGLEIVTIAELVKARMLQNEKEPTP